MSDCRSARRVTLLLTIVVAGCAQTSALVKRTYTPVDVGTTVRLPQLDTDAQVEVGESMVATTKLYPAVKLSSDLAHEGVNMGYRFTLRIPQQTLVLTATDSGGSFFQADALLEFVTSGGQTLPVQGGVFVPSDSTQALEVYWMARDRPTVPLTDSHPGLRVEQTRAERVGKEVFKRELVYEGRSGNTINILYREFADNLARPAFSQELKYDLSAGDVIGYRGARFKVIAATNTSITYRVLKHIE